MATAAAPLTVKDYRADTHNKLVPGGVAILEY